MLPRREPYLNSPPLRDNIITVAMPGITSSRAQIARYTGEDGVDVLENATTWEPHIGFGEISSELSPLLSGNGPYVLTSDVDPPLLYHATCRVAPRLLHNVMASPEMDEIVYNRWSWNPVHWILMIKEYLALKIFSIGPPQRAYSRVCMTNLGGARDQAVCLREVKRAVRIMKSRTDNCKPSLERPLTLKLVLFGCSRGATTTFYTAMKLPLVLAQYVSLVLIEAPFDTLHDVITTSTLFPSFSMWFFRTFCDYMGNNAYDFDPTQVNLHCPVAFVISTRDSRVPNILTHRLIKKVRNECPKIPSVEVLELTHSRHPVMAVGHQEDQDAYVAFVERLYDTYCSGVENAEYKRCIDE